MPASFNCEHCRQYDAPDRKSLRMHQTNSVSCRKKRTDHLQQLRAQFAQGPQTSRVLFPHTHPDSHPADDHHSHAVEDQSIYDVDSAPPPPATDPDSTISDMIENINLDDSPPTPPLIQRTLDDDIAPEPPIVDADAHRPRVEDVVDEDELDYYLREFPSEKEAGAVFGEDARTLFHAIRDDQILKGDEILGPFRDDGEWQLAKWLIKNVGHTQADIFLKLPIVSQFSVEF